MYKSKSLTRKNKSSTDKKVALRGELRGYFRDPPMQFRQHRSAYDRSIADRLWELPIWSEYTSVCLYRSMADEVSTQAIGERAIQEGKVLWEPSKQVGMKPWEDKERGADEPPRELEGIEKLLVVTPGRYFDREGNRIGRGGGYYDMLFSSLKIPYVAVALCYSFQVVDKIDAGIYDVPVHYILTESCCIHAKVRAKV